MRYPRRDKSITPTRDRPGISFRNRSGTVVHQPSNLRVATDVPPPPFLNSQLRSATFTATTNSAATPRSGESFASGTSSASRMGDFSEEDRLFERIFLQLQTTTDMAVKALPTVKDLFLQTMRNCGKSSNPDQPPQFWQFLIQGTVLALQATESLKSRMSLIKLKEPGIRSQTGFWTLCNGFIYVSDLLVCVFTADPL